MSDRAYFIAENNEQRGPFTIDELLKRTLAPDTLVWREGMADWLRADAVPELGGIFAPQAVVAAAPVWTAPDSTTIDPQQLSYRTTMINVQPASGMAIASLTLGIIAIVSICGLSLGPIIGLPTSILALIFGFNGKAKAKRGEAGGGGIAQGGIVLGIVYLSLFTLGAIVFCGFIGIAIWK